MTEQYFSYEPGWSPAQLAKQILALPGVQPRTISTRGNDIIDLDAQRQAHNGETLRTYPMSTPVQKRLGDLCIQQTLHALIVTPDDQPHTLIEVGAYTEQDMRRGVPTERWVLLGGLCSTGRPDVVDVLTPHRITRMTGPQMPPWRVGVALVPDMRHVLVMHQGWSSTEVARNISPVSAWRDTIPFEIWAPPSQHCLDRIQSIAG